MLRETNPHNLTQLIRLPGQQYDEETGLYYNRHRYYGPQQARYITQDPIGLRGGWNFYVYTSNPIIEIDPLGLAGWDSLGNGGLKEVCQQAGSAVTYLPSEEAIGVIHNMETMHNVYNPLSEYVLGISVGSAITGMAGTTFGMATVADKGSACIKDLAESLIKEGERDPQNLALTCGKAFINEGISGFQSKVSDYLVDVLSSYKQKQ